MIYSINNPRVSKEKVHCGFTDMSQTFGQALQAKLAEKGVRKAELARRAGITKQNVGRIVNNTPHYVTGALPKVEVETVKKIAKALDWDVDEALNAAGFAPTQSHTINGYKVELPYGIDFVIPHTEVNSQDEADEFAESVRLAVEIVKARLERQRLTDEAN